MRPTTRIAAVLVLLLAAFLRFHQLEAQSFWNDEGNSARLSERPIDLIIEGTASDVHPPLYYLLLHAWRVGAGDSEFGLRSFSALVGVLTVAAIMALARSIARRRAAVFIMAGLFAAVNPALVYYAQETRMYGLLALLAVLSTWFLWQWVAAKSAGGRRPWLWLGAYAVCIFAGLYTHYFFPIIVLAQGLLVLLYLVAPPIIIGRNALVPDGRLHTALAWLGAVALALLAYAVWVPIFLRSIGARPGLATTAVGFLVDSGAWLAMGTTLPRPDAILPLLAGLGLLVLGLLIGRLAAVVPVVLAAVPIGGSLVVGATDPTFFKFLLVTVPFLCILAGLAWQRQGWWRVVAASLTLVFLAGSLVSLNNIYTDSHYARADYRGMAARIAAEAYPNAAVILDAPNQWEVFTYYHRDGAPVYPLPVSAPDATAVAADLAEIAADHDRIYALFWGDAQRDPEHLVERWLDAHTYKAAEEWVGDVRFVVYAVPPTNTIAQTPAGDVFQASDGPAITLVSYGYAPEQARPGQIIQVQLNWSATGPTAQPVKVFVHLLDAAGNLVAQRDSEPGGGQRPTTGWARGETITDNLGLLIPPDAAPGPYQLRVGLYDAYEPSARLPVTIGDMTSDSVAIGQVEVR